VTGSAAANLPGSVGILSKSVAWTVTLTDPNPDVSQGIGTSGAHKIYVTWGTPSGGVVTEKRINWVCAAASGASTAKAVADGIHSALSGNPPEDGNGGTQTDEWILLSGNPYAGECDEQGRFMVRALQMIGSTGTFYFTYASTDANVEDKESITSGGHTWWLKFDFNNNGAIDNNFEGSVESAGHFYAVWPSLDAASKCLLLRQIGPDNLGATQRYVRTDDGTFFGATVDHFPGTAPYPTCN
jgi:hypothetical protein